MPRDPLLFSALSDRLENPHYYGAPHLAGTRREHNWGPNINTTSSPGCVKVEDNCLLLDFQGSYTMDRQPMSTCSIDPPSRTSSLPSSSSSDSTFLSFPPLSSKPPVFCDGLNEENRSACEFSPFIPPADSRMPSSARICVSSELLSLELANNVDPSLPLEPCFDMTIANAQAQILTNPNEASFDDVLSSLISNTLNSYTAEGPLVQEPFSVAHDELSINDIVAQESFGTSSLGGGRPKASLAITDDCSDLLGSSRQHQSLEGSLHLHVPQGSGNIYEMTRYLSSSGLDGFGRLHLSHCDSDGEFLHPSMSSSVMHGDQSITEELEKTSLYNLRELKDLTFNGVESVFSDIPQSLRSQEFYQYTKEEKGKRIDRYRQKRNERNFSKKIKYACRKALADNRPRIRGRFAKTEETGGGWV